MGIERVTKMVRDRNYGGNLGFLSEIHPTKLGFTFRVSENLQQVSNDVVWYTTWLYILGQVQKKWPPSVTLG